MMLIARNPRGFLHAVSPCVSTTFDDRFRTTMAAQGCTVQLVEAFVAADHAKVSVPAPLPESVPVGPLPALGEEITHPLLGAATVTHLVAGQPVARSPRGEALVKPGQWTPHGPPLPVAVVSLEPPVPVPATALKPSIMPSLF